MDQVVSPRTITVTEARRQWAKVIAEVEAGAEIIVTIRGKPRAKLVPAKKR